MEWRVRRGHVRVRLRPSLVSPAAYARAMEWLVNHRPERVLLSYFVDQRWEYEYLRNAGEAARRIRWLVELYGGGGYCNARRRTISLSSNLRPKTWRHAIDFWRELRGNIDPVTAADNLDRFFAGRWIVYACEPHNGFSVGAFGANHAEHVSKWLKAHRGVRIAEPSDSVFSQSGARVYQSVTVASSPVPTRPMSSLIGPDMAAAVAASGGWCCPSDRETNPGCSAASRWIRRSSCSSKARRPPPSITARRRGCNCSRL